MNISKILALVMLTACAACASPGGWQTTHYTDEFTNAQLCRVQYGSNVGGRLMLPMAGYLNQYFYAESYNGQVRAGVRSEPQISISGDVQIKVGERLYTLTAQDAPLDIAPQMPAMPADVAKAMPKGYGDAMNSITQNVQRLSSPYRAFTGAKAKALLRDMIETGGVIKFRTVGVNAATSSTGEFVADEEFSKALVGCGINL